MYTHVLIGTDEFLYTTEGRVLCLDWEGNIVWESSPLGGNNLIFLGDAFLAETYDKSQNMTGIAFLNFKGEILWQKELGHIPPAGMSASRELLAAAVLKNYEEGKLWVFSKTGDVLWTYDHPARIDQVSVAPDSSCVVFTGYDHCIHCVRDGELVWSDDVGWVDTGWRRRTAAFAPDSSYVVYGSQKSEPKIVVCTLNGDVLWSHPVNKYVRSVAVSSDGQYIFAGSFEYVYKFIVDGTCVWATETGANIDYIALTTTTDYIALGSEGFPSSLIVLNGEGEVLWKAVSGDTLFAVAISPNGRHVAFSNREGNLYIFSNPPQSNYSSISSLLNFILFL